MVESQFPPVGYETQLTTNLWVRVMNPDGIANENSTFRFGEIGVVEDEGWVQVIAVNTETRQILLEYASPEDEERYGGYCPVGTFFFISPEEFLLATGSPEDVTRKLDELKKWVLKKAYIS